MCNSITTLSHSTDHRFIAVCEHGTVHIYWERFTLYLRPEEFRYLSQLLDEVIAGVTYPWSESPEFLEQPFMIWVDDFALRLQGMDFCYFVDLIEQATAKLRCNIGDIPIEANIQIIQEKAHIQRPLGDLTNMPLARLN